MSFRRYMVLIVTILICLFTMSSSALAYVQTDYIKDSSGEHIRIPKAYTFCKVISDFSQAGMLKNAQDLFIDKHDNLYIVDTGNNRILRLNSDLQLTRVYTGSDDTLMREPTGVYVDDDGDLYIADTGKYRILHLTPDGSFVEQFIKPDSDVLGEDFVFQPFKVYINKIGYLTILRRDAFFTMDSTNQFQGYVGATEVGFNVGRVLIRWFATDEQWERIIKQQKTSYSNFLIDDNGMIYATSATAGRNQIRVISSVGKNIYPPGLYGEKSVDSEGRTVMPNLVDLALDHRGIISALDQTTGKIYQYNQDGELLAVFGGIADTKGFFQVPVSIAVDSRGLIYVLDSARNNIQVFEPSKFIKLVHQAVNEYNSGSYDDAKELWEDVLELDENYLLAHTGLGNTYYKEGKWDPAMKEYLMAENKSGYSKAFFEARHEWFRNNFAICIAGIILIMVAFVALYKLCRKYAENGYGGERVKMDYLRSSLGILFHPLDTLRNIKLNRKKVSYFAGIIIMLLLVVVRLFYIFAVHYPLSTIRLRDANIFVEVGRVILPILLWTVSGFFVTSILDGETTMKEIFIATVYCTMPYALFTPIATLFSHIMSLSEQGLFNFIRIGVFVWVGFLLFLALKSMNNYSLKKTIGICFLILFCIAVVCATVILFLSLFRNLVDFISGIFTEIQLALTNR